MLNVSHFIADSDKFSGNRLSRPLYIARALPTGLIREIADLRKRSTVRCESNRVVIDEALYLARLDLRPYFSSVLLSPRTQ